MKKISAILAQFDDDEKIKAVKSIKDINDHFDYDDQTNGGKGDSYLVSCGQNGTYNELEYIYDTYLAPFVIADEETTKEKALQAMCKACFNISSPRKRSDFYKFIEKELDCEFIFPDRLKK